MNIFNVMGMYQQFMNNPMGMLGQKYKLPQNVSDPNEILQHLLNTGQVNQQQVNNIMQLKNNPMIQQLIGRK